MTRPKLVTALQSLGHTAALKDGTVQLPDFELEFVELPHIIQAFRRMVRGLEFDVSEMALTTYLTARAFRKPFTALPIFPERRFHHGAILYNTQLGIGRPKDLEGRKVGISRGYTVTTGVWARGILQHEYGVDLEKITWVLSGDEHVVEFRPPPNVVSLGQGKTLEDSLICGELAAAIGIKVEHPHLAPLIPDAAAHAFRRLEHDAYYPINHLVVVKEAVLEKYPHVAVQLFEAFTAAKRQYLDRLRQGLITAPSAGDQMYARVAKITGCDPLPFGLEPNRAMLETLMGYAREQGILPRSYALEEVFAPGTTQLIG